MAEKVVDDCKKLEETITSNFENLTEKFDKLDQNLSKFNNKIAETIATLNQKDEKIQKLQNELTEKTTNIETLEEKVDDLTIRLTECEGRFGDVQKQLLLQTEMLIEQNEKFDTIDNNSKSHALIVKNLPESQNTAKQDIDALFGMLQINLTCERSCDKVYRLGRPSQNQTNPLPRPIYVNLIKESQKGEIFLAMPNLRGTALAKVYVDNDQSATIQRQMGNLRAVAAVARNQGMRAQVRQGKVIINDTPYPHDKLHRLPPQIAIERIKTIEIQGIGIGYQGEFSPLLNMSKFEVEYDNEVYPTAEHAIVATRAKIENNPTMEAMAKFHSDAFTVKSKAKRWDESITWQNIKLDTHEDIIYQKFKNNPILKKMILDTGDKRLFECTMDRYYGVGYSLAQRNKIKKSGNPGKNQGGQTLMKVRDRIRIEENPTADLDSSLDSN